MVSPNLVAIRLDRRSARGLVKPGRDLEWHAIGTFSDLIDARGLIAYAIAAGVVGVGAFAHLTECQTGRLRFSLKRRCGYTLQISTARRSKIGWKRLEPQDITN